MLRSLPIISTCKLSFVDRYGLGIRRLRNTGSLGSTDERSAAATASAASAAAAGASSGVGNALGEASMSTGMGSVDNGGVVKRGERDPSGNGKSSVSQCFEQVPAMFFEKTFSLQVRINLPNFIFVALGKGQVHDSSVYRSFGEKLTVVLLALM